MIAKYDKIYILPTGHGLLFISGIVVMVLTGATYGNNLIYMLAFILFSTCLVGMVQTHNNLRKVSLQLIHIEDGFAEEWTSVDVKLSHKLNVGRQNLTVRLAKNKTFLSQEGTLDYLPPMGNARVQLQVKVAKRGVFQFPRWVVETRFPMGIFRAWKYLPSEEQIYIYPSLKGKKYLPRLSEVSEGQDMLRSRQGQSQEMDFKEHRPHREGESHRHIDWKVVARTGDYLTKVFEGESGTVHRFDFSNLGSLTTEERLSQLAIWVQEAYKKSLAFELILPKKRLEAGNSPQHYRQSLRELTRFESSEGVV